MAAPSSDYLAAVVDMGSNGIRFTITDLSPSHARLLPVVYSDRAGVSLYDAQFSSRTSSERQPISLEIQDTVIRHFLRFKRVCSHYGIADEKVHVVATEAVRISPNSSEFCSRIEAATGWLIQCLTPSQEAFYGVTGVASCAASVNGLVVDMGGGSCQISWVKSSKGEIETSEDVYISLPYGAAALTRRLEEASAKGASARKELEAEVASGLSSAFTRLQASASFVPQKITAYVCGGGLRGWGYFLMSLDQQYPISLIDGLEVTLDKFEKGEMDCQAEAKSRDIFGLSKRRKKHLNAIAFLARILCRQFYGTVEKVRFCQAGIREGLLFDSLSTAQRAQDPLMVATAPYGTKSAPARSQILFSALPQTTHRRWKVPEILDKSMTTAVANMMFKYIGMVKQYRKRTALRCTTEGDLALARGLSHQQRAVLALVLCERWDGDLLPADKVFLKCLQHLVGPQATWWSRYLGRIARLVGTVCPDGVFENDDAQSPKGPIFTISDVAILPDEVVEGVQLMRLQLEVNHRGDAFDEDSDKAMKKIEAMGKYDNYAPVSIKDQKKDHKIDLRFGMRVTVLKMSVPEQDLILEDEVPDN
ncbi:Proteasome subunit beta type-5 [Ascosphaera pollenicola]|nr:Proteasome subunit beta type-5 [Ascosphaera pollenicola]